MAHSSAVLLLTVKLYIYRSLASKQTQLSGLTLSCSSCYYSPLTSQLCSNTSSFVLSLHELPRREKKIGIIHERGSLHCHSLIFVHLPYPYTPVFFLFSLQPCIVSPSLEKGECLGEETVCYSNVWGTCCSLLAVFFFFLLLLYHLSRQISRLRDHPAVVLFILFFFSLSFFLYTICLIILIRWRLWRR